jgi:acetoin utilization deacetylase AcuC-like enzyme
MDTWYSEHHHGHDGHSEISRGELLAGFESPIRAERVRAAVLGAGLGALRTPPDAGLAPIHAVHDAAYVEFLRGAWSAWRALGRTHPALPMIWHAGQGLPRVLPRHIDGQLGCYSFDGGSAIVEGTWTAAYWSAQCALAGAAALRDGAPSAFALCRPPGHHAAAALMGGYCYLNNAAIAAQALLGGRFARVAVLDIDYHHGNGTQAIFWRRDDVFFASLHADPHDDYPYLSGHADERGDGPGLGHNLNLPLPAGTEAPAYLATLERAIDAVLDKRCGAVVVSLGVDTFERDPISRFRLKSDDYLEIGRRLRRLGVPLLFVFEGGYATDEVGVNAVNVLLGAERG